MTSANSLGTLSPPVSTNFTQPPFGQDYANNPSPRVLTSFVNAPQEMLGHAPAPSNDNLLLNADPILAEDELGNRASNCCSYSQDVYCLRRTDGYFEIVIDSLQFISINFGQLFLLYFFNICFFLSWSSLSCFLYQAHFQLNHAKI